MTLLQNAICQYCKIYIMYKPFGTLKEHGHKMILFYQTGSVFPHHKVFTDLEEKFIPVWWIEVESYEHWFAIWTHLQPIAVKTFQDFPKHVIRVQ